MQQAKNRGGSWTVLVQSVSAGVFHRLICAIFTCRFFFFKKFRRITRC